jgi:branched-subunit amino acid transport protein
VHKAPFAVQVATATLHCGSGCALGDILAEWLAFSFPAVAIAFGWHSLFVEKTYSVWILDFLIAFILGVAFKYFTITPMRKLTPAQGVVAALKADALSLLRGKSACTV